MFPVLFGPAGLTPFGHSVVRLSSGPDAAATILVPSEEKANAVQFALVPQRVQDAPESREMRIHPKTSLIATVLPLAEEATAIPEVCPGRRAQLAPEFLEVSTWPPKPTATSLRPSAEEATA